MASSEWMTQALCREYLYPEAWFQESLQTNTSRLARAICRVCPVQAECFEAGKKESAGIWGGKSRSLRGERHADRARLSALGAARRIQALAAIGWSPTEIQADINKYSSVSVTSSLVHGIGSGDEKWVDADVYGSIVRAYDRMRRHLSKSGARASHEDRAKERGWLPPRAWSGLDIDDPEVDPRADVP